MTGRTERITTSRRERNPEMANFKSGTFPVPVGEIEFSVAGLSLVFAPSSVIVSVRQPSAEADIISAYVIGTPTTDFASRFPLRRPRAAICLITRSSPRAELPRWTQIRSMSRTPT